MEYFKKHENEVGLDIPRPEEKQSYVEERVTLSNKHFLSPLFSYRRVKMHGWISSKNWLVLFGCLFLLMQPACESVKSNISSLTGGNEEAEYEETDIPMSPVPQLNKAYKGKKIVVSSFESKNLRGIYSRYGWLRGWLGSASTEYAVQFLSEAGFEVLEGQGGQMSEVFKELELQQSGAVDSSQAVEMGEMGAASLIFVGAITDFTQVDNRKKNEVCLPGMGCVKLGGGKLKYEVETSGRIIDIKTRKIVVSDTASFKKVYTDSSFNARVSGYKVGSEEDNRVQREASGKIFRKALNSLAIKLVNKLNSKAM